MADGFEKQACQQVAASAENALGPAAQPFNQTDGAICLNTPNTHGVTPSEPNRQNSHQPFVFSTSAKAAGFQIKAVCLELLESRFDVPSSKIKFLGLGT